MKIGVIKERAAQENRVAISPDAVKKFTALGWQVTIEKGAGNASTISDEMLSAAGATLAATAEEVLSQSQLLLCVQLPSDELIENLPQGAIIVGSLNPYRTDLPLALLNRKKIQAFALEWLPRISRAQSMDVLSSQANLAGYRAVIDAVAQTGKVFPMMMTAAGTVPPAKVLVLGAGVAGLQAVATAKRLGAVVSAFDVRPAVKEQVESLGAKFVEVKADPAEQAETKGGYAKEMSEDYKQRQSQLIFDTIKAHDIVISTALIPGKQAPELITQAMVEAMKPGSVIVDLAVALGGNCRLTELDKVVNKHSVTLMGYSNVASRCAADASPLYARNLYTFVSTLMVNKEKQFAIQWEDELIKGTALTRDGNTIHPQLGAA